MQIQAKVSLFDDVHHLLIHSQVLTSPAEIHGMLCGFVCAGKRLNGGFWIDTLLKRINSRPNFAQQQQKAILDLYEAACHQLSGNTPEFNLLLPPESYPLLERAEALSFWCQGFLYGLSLGNSPIAEDTSDAIHEALFCIAELAKLDFTKLNVADPDKFAFEEAKNFILKATPKIYQEFNENGEDNIGKNNSLLH